MVPDPLGTSASIVQLVAALATAARAAHRGLQGDPEGRALLDIFEKSLRQAVDGEPLDVPTKERLFAVIRSLVMESEQFDWLFDMTGAILPFEDVAEIKAAAPNVTALVERVQKAFFASLVEEAGRFGSPLQGRVVVETVTETLEILRELKDRVGNSGAMEDLPLPCIVKERLIALRRCDPALAEKVVRWLAVDAPRRSVALDLLVTDPPDWLAGAPGLAWEAVAFLAEGHGRVDIASTAFEHAADSGMSERARLLVRAAVSAAAAGDRARATDLLAKAERSAATDGETALVAAAAAAIEHDAEDGSTRDRALHVTRAVDSALAADAPERVMLLGWRAQALLNLDRLDDAIDTLESAVDTDESLGGPRIALARALGFRAADDLSSTRVADAQQVLHHALIARDLRRSWYGDSREAAELACGAAFMLGDWPLVVRLGSVRTDGATSDEVDSASIQQLVLLARLQMGDEAGANLLEPRSEFDRAWTQGVMLARSPETREPALAAFLEAVALATDEVELDRAQRGVAQLGHLPIPRIDEVQRRDSDHAGALIGLAHFHARDYAAAVQQLRPLTSRSRLAAMALAETYDALERHDDAAALLADAGQRFRDPYLFTRLAMFRLRANDYAGAFQAAQAGLAYTPPIPAAREDLRFIQIESAVRRRDAFAVAEATGAALADGIDEARVFWTHIEALAELRRFREAWRLLRNKAATELADERQAIAYLHVHARAAPGDVSRAADVLDRFHDAHDVLGIGLGLFLSVDFDEDVDADAVRRMQYHLRAFTERFPDSPIFRSTDVTPDDAQLLREQFREMLHPDPGRDQQVRELSERTAAGRVPVGLTAAVLGRSYLSIVLGGETIGFTCIPSGDALALDVMTAERALDGSVVVDLSSLCVASVVPDLWTDLAAVFSQLRMHHDHFAEIDELIFQKPSAGTLHWDHRADTWAMTETSDEDREAFRNRRRWLRDRADDVHLEYGSVELEDLGDAAKTGSWARAIALARELDTPLWCDDVATAAVARTLGIATFSTFGLLNAMRGVGRLTDDRFTAALNAMYLAHADDLPLTPEALVELARQNNFAIGPAVHPVSRPAFWQDRGSAFAAFIDLAEALCPGGINGVASLLQSAALGVTRSQVSGSAMSTIARLFVGATFACRVRPEEVPTLIGTLRAVSHHYDLEDPLVPCALALYATIVDDHGPAKAAQFVSALFSELDDADRHAATRAILSE